MPTALNELEIYLVFLLLVSLGVAGVVIRFCIWFTDRSSSGPWERMSTGRSE